jgi:hypothetical protein
LSNSQKNQTSWRQLSWLFMENSQTPNKPLHSKEKL